MSTTWTLTRERVADKALEHCRVLGVGKVASFEDRALALETMDALLKELPIYGYSWPKISVVQSSLSLVAATSPTAMPADYYGSALFTLIGPDSKEIPFRLMTLSEWNAIADKTYAADYPDRGYLSPDRKLWTWPVQNANRTLKFFYQKVIDDTVSGSTPDISVPWLLGLSFGIAANIGFAFGVSRTDRMDFEAKWSVARTRGINADIMNAPIRIEAFD
jgi:hypothetical protein